MNLPIGDGYIVEGGAQWVGPGQTAVLDLATFGAWLDEQRVSGDEREVVDTASTLTFGVKTDKLSLLWVLFCVHSAGAYAKLESIEGGAQQDRIVGASQILSFRMAERLKDRLMMNVPLTGFRNWQRQSDAVEIVAGNKIYRAKAVVLTLPPAVHGQNLIRTY